MLTKEEIKAVRVDLLKETQDVFAKRFGVDQATIHRWETRGPPNHPLMQMAVQSVLEGLHQPTTEAT